MLQSVDAEVLMVAGYSVFLILTAFGLEWVARCSHRRCEQLRIAGFKYHHQPDIWECPTGQSLTPVAVDHSRGSVRYRAPAHACNACSMKEMCTASDDGREIEHNPSAWLQSELARFQRGISLTLLFLAELLLVIEILLHNKPVGTAIPWKLARANHVARNATALSILRSLKELARGMTQRAADAAPSSGPNHRENHLVALQRLERVRLLCRHENHLAAL